MGVAKSANYIKKIWSQPCNAPSIDLIIETAFRAAAPVLIEYFTYGCFDILKQRAGIGDGAFEKLKGSLHSPYPRQKKGERTPCGRGISGGIARMRPMDQLGDTGKLWHASGAATVSRGLWWMWVADLGGQFLMNWHSLLYQASNCDLPISGYARCPLSSIFTDSPNDGTVLINCLLGRPCFVIGGNVIQSLAGCETTITYNCIWEPFLGLEQNRGPVTTWLEDDQGQTSARVTSLPGTANHPAQTGGGWTRQRSQLFEPRSYKIRFNTNGHLMGCVGGNVAVSTRGQPTNLIPPGCNPGGRFAPKKGDRITNNPTLPPGPAWDNPR